MDTGQLVRVPTRTHQLVHMPTRTQEAGQLVHTQSRTQANSYAWSRSIVVIINNIKYFLFIFMQNLQPISDAFGDLGAGIFAWRLL